MTLSLEPAPNPDSLLRRLDPRWKLGSLIALTILIACLTSLVALGFALGLSWVLIGLGRLPLNWVGPRLGWIALVLVIFVVPLPLLVPGQGWTWGFIHFSQAGVYLGLLILLRGMTIVSIFLVLLATATLESTLKAAHALRIPGIFIQIALMSYRYVFLVVGELQRLRVALRVRGFRQRGDRHTYRTIGHIAGTLLVRSYDRGERVSQAMRCRGFDGQFRCLADFRTQVIDLIFFGIVLIVALALVALNFLSEFKGNV